MLSREGGRELLPRKCKAKSRYCFSVGDTTSVTIDSGLASGLGESSLCSSSHKVERVVDMTDTETLTGESYDEVEESKTVSDTVKSKPRNKVEKYCRKSRSLPRKYRSESRLSMRGERSELSLVSDEGRRPSEGARPIPSRRESASRSDEQSHSDCESESDENEISSKDMKTLIKSLATSLLENGSKKVSEYSQREINAIPPYRDSDEIHSYVTSLEADLTDLKIPRKEWKRILLKKITPKARKIIRGFICERSCSFDELRTALVSKLGLQKGEVTDKLFGWEREYRHLDPISRFQHLRDLMDRLVLHCTKMNQLPRVIVTGIFRATLNSQEKCLLDSHDIDTYEDLYHVASLLKTNSVKHSHDKGRSKYDHNGRSYNSSSENVKCFKCHGFGHKAVDCRKPDSSTQIVCYVCNTPGHKAPDCPSRADKVGRNSNESVKSEDKIVKSQRHQPKTQAVASNCNPLIEFSGKCNGRACMILPDSGAVMSMVSRDLVDDTHYLGSHENLVMANGQMICRPLAKVEFEIMGRVFEQVVAVSQQGERRSFVFLSAPPENERDAVSAMEALCDREVRRHGASQVSACEPDRAALSAAVTRAASKKAAKREAEQIVRESDIVPPDHIETGVSAVAAELAGEEVEKDTEVVGEEYVRKDGEKEAVDADENVLLGSPCLGEASEKDKLRVDVEADESLSQCKELASKKVNGYMWDDGLLFHEYIDECGDCMKRLVLPVCRRENVLELVHDKSGHIGVKSMRRLLNRKFTWPGMGCDIVKYVRSCTKCLQFNSSGNRKAKMVERPVIHVPFESVAFDLVGPLPKARGGVKYVLTYICLASRWPDAVPLRNVSAESVASGMTTIICRTGIPLKILTDRGTVFMGKVVDKLCAVLGVDQLHTSPYRPQSNGILERFHGTLKPMLSKAVENKVDWSDFLPMALFAIRQVPCSSTGFSPHELVFGRNLLGPLDLVYAGWVEDTCSEIDVGEWVVCLQDKLMLLHDLATKNELDTIEKRSVTYNKGKSERVHKVGDLVLIRVPGLHVSLSASWEGPYEVTESVSKVTYKVKKRESEHVRLVHINNMKAYSERKKYMAAVSVIAEENSDMEKSFNCKLLSDEESAMYSESDIASLLEKYKHVFSESPGLCTTGSCKIVVKENSEPVNIPSRSVPMHIQVPVEHEINRLLQANIIERADEEWQSPIVPIRKKDGSIRLCVDYRGLNSITPLRRFWLPSLREILDRVGPCNVLSKLDLTSGYHQIKMDPDSMKYTTFGCPSGQFRFLRMPFGLKNAPAIFQAIVENVLQPVKQCSKNYIDDVIVYSQSWNDHIRDVGNVLDCLNMSGLRVKLGKCEFGRATMLYLGHQIGNGCMSVPQARVSAIAEYPLPTTKKKLRAFLGTIGYYREFVPGFAEHSCKLSPATSLAAPNRIAWTGEMMESFRKLKCLLSNSVALFIPTQSDGFVLYTDASGGGVGGCLHVVRDKELPVAFFSRQLRGAEPRYTVTELESLAIVESLHHFEHYLLGTTVTVMTDHRACLALLSSSHLNKRLLRFALRLQNYDVKLVYRPGKLHDNADGLSRMYNDEDDDPQADARDVSDVYQLSPMGKGLAVGPVEPSLEKEKKRNKGKRRNEKEERRSQRQ